MNPKTAVITGGNSGIGFAIANQLLKENSEHLYMFNVCLACRNVTKAQNAKNNLQLKFPNANISIVQLDTSSIGSVCDASRNLTAKFKTIDYLYFNAGMMPQSKINFRGLWPFTLGNIKDILATGGKLLIQQNQKLPNGLQEVFASNLFGHYALLRNLEEFLTKQSESCHVIWTSSRSSVNIRDIDTSDLQCANSSKPYQCSKVLIDILSTEINKRWNCRGIFSNVACPGLVISELMYKIIPKFIWTLFLVPFLFILRVFIPESLTLTPKNGAFSLVWLSSQDPFKLSHGLKYLSCSNSFGTLYIKYVPIPEIVDPSILWDYLHQLYNNFNI